MILRLTTLQTVDEMRVECLNHPAEIHIWFNGLYLIHPAKEQLTISYDDAAAHFAWAGGTDDGRRLVQLIREFRNSIIEAALHDDVRVAKSC